MPIAQSLPNYFQSFSSELDIIKNRVRDIIGDKHWASDGSHKEVILKDVLRKFIPSKYEIGSGFILDEQGRSSKQIDILIYDNNSPVFFRSDDFVILPRTYVRCIIEVKTDLNKGNAFYKALENLKSAQEVLNKKPSELYSAIFSYDYNNIENKDITEVGKDIFKKISDFYKTNTITDNTVFLKKNALTSICINRHIYGLHWNEIKDPVFGIYDTRIDSFNFFVSNLLNSLDNRISHIDKLWYPTSKESRQILKENLLTFNVRDC
ncbi:hypothetical protein LIT32_12395 [Bacillus sp. CMF21]|nr:hypothetical protein LIT32_12395 [Bacillus sp. CMF21]